MKKILLSLFLLVAVSFSSEFCIFDANGVCVKKVQNSNELGKVLHELKGKRYYAAEQSLSSKHKIFNASSVSPRKALGKRRWYELDWNQSIKLCPEKNFNTGDGSWIVNGHAYIDKENCVHVEGSPYTRSILVLYARNPEDLTDADSSWLLINQTIVELAKKKFWVPGIRYPRSEYREEYAQSLYKGLLDTATLQQDLIVDRTELRIRDALWLLDSAKGKSLLDEVAGYYPSTNLEDVLDYPATYVGILDKLRSEKDWLTFPWKWDVPVETLDTNQGLYVSFGFFSDSTVYNSHTSVLDTTANGYRLPFQREAEVLRSGGKAQLFAWGDTLEEAAMQRFMNVRCSSSDPGLYPVKQYAPNEFGLYDVYGNAKERYSEIRSAHHVTESSFSCGEHDLYRPLDFSCAYLWYYQCKPRDSTKVSWHALWFGFQGMRLVRKLE